MRDRTPLLSNLDPRESMKRNLPDWMQPFLTQLTAKPYVGEQPHQKSVGFDVVQRFAVLGISVAVSSFAIAQSDARTVRTELSSNQRLG
jgi:hypothetical protein